MAVTWRRTTSLAKPGLSWGATRIYQSKDRGETWTQIASFTPATWGSLFWHAGALYHMAFTGDPGSVVMRRSSDHGRTWTEPKDAESGVLFTGGYHSAPVPVVVHNGRIWRAAEEIVNDLKWPRHFEAVMLSAPADGDLLEAANWTRSSGVVFDAEWLPGRRPGWLEGNAVVTPEGNLVNMLRG
ncbi:MAG: hypothetical protein NVV74_10280 [Magnetospirillum sp.]|nr:hypothetical protein [Magnetospirillum sp.]